MTGERLAQCQMLGRPMSHVVSVKGPTNRLGPFDMTWDIGHPNI